MKPKVRKAIQDKLSVMDVSSYQKRSETIHTNLFQSSAWKQARTIGVTISRFPEVDTYKIIQKAWAEGKTVAAPRCVHKERLLQFYKIHSFEDVESSYYGLLEPLVSLAAVRPKEIDLLIVPGLGYDKKGYRIGFGGGYYDRFLAHFKGDTVSLFFSEQLLSSIPIENWDQPVNCLIGEASIYFPRNE